MAVVYIERKSSMKRKWLAIGIILLFVGVTIAPTINFNTVKALQQSESKGRITTLEHKQVQLRQTPLFTSFLNSLKENKGAPSCYLVVSILIFIWFLIGSVEAIFDMYLSGTLQYPLLTIVYAITFSFLVGITWPISLPSIAVFLFLLILDFIIDFPYPYKSIHPHFQYKFVYLFENMSISRLLFSHLTSIRN